MEQQLDNSRFTANERFEISGKIDSLRIQKGLTQEKLSELTGINRDVISRHLNGTACSSKTLTRYAIALGCQVEDLLPNSIACQINGSTEEEQKYWSLLKGLTEEQRQAVYHMISVMSPKRNNS